MARHGHVVPLCSPAVVKCSRILCHVRDKSWFQACAFLEDSLNGFCELNLVNFL